MARLRSFFLAQPSEPPRRRVSIVHGMGDIGKTQLCANFARAHQEDFNSVFWLDGSSKDDCNNRWLLVIDNMDRDWQSGQDAQASDYISMLPTADHGNVLITTRLEKRKIPNASLSVGRLGIKKAK